MVKIRLLADEYIFRQGDEGNCAFFVSQVFLDIHINNKKVGFIPQGEILGEMSLLLREKRSASIKASRPCELIQISQEFFENLLEESDPKIVKFIKYLCTRLVENIKGVKDLPFDKSTFEKLLQNENKIIKSIGKQIFRRCSKT